MLRLDPIRLALAAACGRFDTGETPCVFPRRGPKGFAAFCKRAVGKIDGACVKRRVAFDVGEAPPRPAP